MKKLILVAALVCAAAVSQAASVGWTCLGATSYASGDYSIFVIGKNGVTSSAQIKAIVAAGGLSSASVYAFDTAVVTAAGAASKTATTSGKTITYSGSGTDTYSAFMFMESVDGMTASYTSTVNITMDNNATSKTFGFASQTTNLTANGFAVAPEPTSGLLVLLGMAGLALKRKRA